MDSAGQAGFCKSVESVQVYKILEKKICPVKSHLKQQFTGSLFTNEGSSWKTFAPTVTSCKNTNCSRGTLGLKVYYCRLSFNGSCSVSNNILRFEQKLTQKASSTWIGLEVAE